MEVDGKPFLLRQLMVTHHHLSCQARLLKCYSVFSQKPSKVHRRHLIRGMKFLGKRISTSLQPRANLIAFNLEPRDVTHWCSAAFFAVLICPLKNWIGRSSIWRQMPLATFLSSHTHRTWIEVIVFYRMYFPHSSAIAYSAVCWVLQHEPAVIPRNGNSCRIAYWQVGIERSIAPFINSASC